MGRIMISRKIWDTFNSYEHLGRYLIKNQRGKKFYDSITDIDAITDEGDRMFFKYNNIQYYVRTFDINNDTRVIDFEIMKVGP